MYCCWRDACALRLPPISTQTPTTDLHLDVGEDTLPPSVSLNGVAKHRCSPSYRYSLLCAVAPILPRSPFVSIYFSLSISGRPCLSWMSPHLSFLPCISSHCLPLSLSYPPSFFLFPLSLPLSRFNLSLSLFLSLSISLSLSLSVPAVPRSAQETIKEVAQGSQDCVHMCGGI